MRRGGITPAFNLMISLSGHKSSQATDCQFMLIAFTDVYHSINMARQYLASLLKNGLIAHFELFVDQYRALNSAWSYDLFYLIVHRLGLFPKICEN